MKRRYSCSFSYIDEGEALAKKWIRRGLLCAGLGIALGTLLGIAFSPLWLAVVPSGLVAQHVLGQKGLRLQRELYARHDRSAS